MDESPPSDAAAAEPPRHPAPTAAAPGQDADADSLRAFQSRLGRDFAAAMTARLGWSLTVRPRGARACAVGDFRDGVAERSCCFGLLGAAAGEAPLAEADLAAFVELPQQIAFVVLARLLGATAEEHHTPDRPLTPIERRVLSKMVHELAAALGRCWPADAPAVQWAPADVSPPAEQPVVVLRFATEVRRRVGRMRVCLPRSHLPAAEGPQDDRPAGVGGAPLELSVDIEDAAIDPEDLRRLRRGDIVVTDTAADGEVIVKIAGIPKFAARLGTADGRRAIKIVRKLS
jgi:flagellar motor switch protein FliM